MIFHAFVVLSIGLYASCAPRPAVLVQEPQPGTEEPPPPLPAAEVPPVPAASPEERPTPRYRCPLAACDIVSRFGPREVPGKGESETLDGLNLRVRPGQPVMAAREGKVIFSGFSKSYVSRADKNEQRRLVIVLHEDGQSSRYVHLATLAVRPPQSVKAGDVLGTAASSDEWVHPVLRFEIRAPNGQPLDPETFLDLP